MGSRNVRVMRTIGLAFAALTAACFDPSDHHFAGHAAGDDADDPTDTDDPSAADGDSEGSSGEPGESAGDPSGDDGPPIDTGADDDTGLPRACGNGIVEPGELCFAPPIVIDTPIAGGGGAIADIDGDGHLDVVITDTYPGAGPRILLGDGGGGFAAPLIAPAGAEVVGPVAVGAIADGAVDIVASSWNSAWRWRGVGDGSFDVPSIAGPTVADVVLADLDADGRADLVTCASADVGLQILLADADEAFAFASPATAGGASVTDRVVITGDLDLDGIVDLVSGGGSGVGSFRGLGGAIFATPEILGPEEPVGAIALGDFDADGAVDIAVGYSNVIRIMLGHGDATFAAPLEIETTDWIVGLAAPDLDGDAASDLVGLGFGGTVVLSLSDGTAGFPVLQLVSLPDGGTQNDLAIGDLDENGSIDILTVAVEGGPAHVLFSNP